MQMCRRYSGSRSARRLAAIFAVCAAFIGTPLAAQVPADDKSILWWLSPFPPNIMPLASGEVGIVHQMLLDIASRMPDRQHRFEEIPSSRFHAETTKGVRACSAPILRTPARDAYLAFTKAGLQVLPNRLFVRPKLADKVVVGPDGVADLAAALRAGLRMAVPQHRSFGADIDKVIVAAPEVSRVAKNEQPFLMYQAERVDAFIGLPHEVGYHFRNHARDYRSFALPGAPLIFVPLVACTRGDWGQAIVERIDALNVNDVTIDFYSRYETWLDADSRAAFERAFTDANPGSPVLKHLGGGS